MKIVEIKQLDNGIQERPYADHIYRWNIETAGITEREEIFDFCQKYLKSSKYNEQYYKSHCNKGADIFYSGYYILNSSNSGHTWTYSVIIPYCD